MLCDKCKKNNATVHITKIVNDNKEQLNLCEECAKETGNLSISSFDISDPFTFQNVISGIMDYISGSSDTQKYFETTCSSCGTNYSEFKKNGFLGCSDCYKNFISTLMPVIRRVQGNVEHIGKIPSKAGKDILQKRKLIELKEQLQKAISCEEYEKAATIRDEIKQIQKNL